MRKTTVTLTALLVASMFLIQATANDYDPWLDTNDDGKIDIFDVVFAAGAYGSRLGDPNWNMIADIVPPIDKVDIFDIVAVAGHYGEKW